jgi:hypothetical protein
VREVLAQAGRFGEVIDGLSADDMLVRIRCADAAEKITRVHPEWLQPYKAGLLRLASNASEPELRWHLAQMLPRLVLARRERSGAVATLKHYLDDKSSIVRTFSLQALADLTGDDDALRRDVLGLLTVALRTGSPAMRSRARRLLARWTARVPSQKRETTPTAPVDAVSIERPRAAHAASVSRR